MANFTGTLFLLLLLFAHYESAFPVCSSLVSGDVFPQSLQKKSVNRVVQTRATILVGGSRLFEITATIRSSPSTCCGRLFSRD